MTTQQPKSTTCLITPTVSELAEQSTRAKPTINQKNQIQNQKHENMPPQKKTHFLELSET